MFNPVWDSLVSELNDTIYFAAAEYNETRQIADLIPGLNNESMLPGSDSFVLGSGMLSGDRASLIDFIARNYHICFLLNKFYIVTLCLLYCALVDH